MLSNCPSRVSPADSTAVCTNNPKLDLRDWVARLWFPIFIGLLSAALVWFRTSLVGTLVSHDSIRFIHIAFNLTTEWTYSGELASRVLPAFPASLVTVSSVLGREVHDFVTAARVINSVSFGLTAGLAAFWLQSMTRTRWAVLLGSVPLVFGSPLLWAFGVLTEPLFNLFTMASLYVVQFVLSRRTGERYWVVIVTAGLLAFCASSTRFLGVAVASSGAFCVLLANLTVDSKPLCWPSLGRFLKALWQSGIYLTIGIIPVVVWITLGVVARSDGPVFGAGIAHNAGNSMFFYLWKNYQILMPWFFPKEIAGHVVHTPLSIAIIVGLASVGICWLFRFLKRERQPHPENFGQFLKRAAPELVLLTFVILYFTNISISMWLGKEPVRSRFLAPIHMPLVLLMVPVLERMILRIRLATWPNRVAYLGVSCLLLFALVFSSVRVTSRLGHSAGYDSPHWAESELTQYLRANPFGDAVVFSNLYALAYYVIDEADRKVRPFSEPLIPIRFAKLESNPVYVLYLYHHAEERKSYNSEDMDLLVADGQLQLVFDGLVGRLYRVVLGVGCPEC